MNIYFHIGTNKTGSSYLQSLLMVNRKLLISHGYYLPFSKRDKQMLEGVITSGNGEELQKIIQSNDVTKIEKYLQKKVEEAEINICSSIVFSNEKLFNVFANQNQLSCLIRAIQNCKIEAIKVLLFLREPVGHILSTYKHKSKFGRNDDFNYWLNNFYETTAKIESFTNNLDLHSIHYSFYGYSNNPEILKRNFFLEWLGIVESIDDKFKIVNGSLNFNELIILQELRKNLPNAVHFFYNELIKIDKNYKEENLKLQQYLIHQSNHYIKRNYPIYQSLKEKIIISGSWLKSYNEYNSSEVENLTFEMQNVVLTKAQLESFITAFKKYNKYRISIKFYFNNLKHLLIRLLNLQK